MRRAAWAQAPAERTPADRSRRRLALVWSLMWLNALTFEKSSALPIEIPIPSHVGKVITQGALLAAFVVALTVNSRGLVRRNLFMCLFSLLAVTGLMMSVRLVGIGTMYRGFRLVLFVVVLWLTTPWWGNRDLTLLKAQLRVLGVILGLTLVGAVVAHHKAFAYGGRLSNAFWPTAPTQVAHYVAELVGLVAVLWMAGLVRRRTALFVITPGLVALVLTHTRTALAALAVGLIVASLSLLTSRRRVRRLLAAAVIAVALVGPAVSPFVSRWLERGESSSELSTLTGRTEVWTLLVDANRPLPNLIFGEGMTNDGFDGLSIDDSWLATYLDQGVVGDVIEAVMFLSLLFLASTRPRGPARAAALFLIVYALLASFTETGIGEASTYMLDLALAASLLVPQWTTPGPAPTGDSAGADEDGSHAIERAPVAEAV